MRAAEFFNQWQPHLSVGLEFFRFEGRDFIAEVGGYHSQSPHDGPIGRLPSHHTVSSQTRTFLGRGQQPCRRPLRVKSDGLTVGLSLPLCPQLRTFSATVGMSQTCQKRKWSDVRLRQCLATRFSWQPRLQCNDSRRTGIVFGIMVKAAISLMDPGLVANSMEKLRESMNSTRRISTPAR